MHSVESLLNTDIHYSSQVQISLLKNVHYYNGKVVVKTIKKKILNWQVIDSNTILIQKDWDFFKIKCSY